MKRRDFLRQAGLAAGAGQAVTQGQTRAVAIILDPRDPVASSAPARWAAGELERALAATVAPVRRHDRVEQAAAGDLCIVARGSGPASAVPEAITIRPGKIGGRPVLLASGGDPRGLVYALLELADRAACGADLHAPAAERPANAIRSIARYFESDVEDKSWFHDRSFWASYLTTLAANRYNRFSMSFGLGYNFPRNARDVYFYFTYPFLLSVAGYRVRAVPLPDAERDRNLETLRFIGEETVRRGLQFQLALWTHAYQWADSPHANYTIEGLTPENHAAYCRDALRAVLEACPSISGVTFRIHGESGVPEGSYDFWRTVFEGIVRTGRKIEIDMHAKGMDQKMIDVALATGMPVNISPKYWAEHMGLPYHQAAIRELEMPPRDRQVEGAFALSSGSRRFLRYGYGDLLKEHRRFGVLHRIWPGTQRVLLWGDPAMAAGYGRFASFCGSLGVELCEPLSFKGRMGSGTPGGRCAYADASMNPKFDFEKYAYQYRVWGRSIYNPDTSPDTWRRYLRKHLQGAAEAAEAALANASRVLPLITTAHGVSGSNNAYWPEMYTNMPIVDPARKHPYGDTPSPKRFGTVSAFDPQLFLRIDDCAEEMLNSRRTGKYSPLEVARWLDDFGTAAASHLKNAETRASRSPEFRRLAVDVFMQSALARFFAWKLRSGVLWALHDRTGDRTALEEALKAYRTARSAWAEMAERAKGVYAADVSYGMTPHLRGHWLDRLPAIDEDIADMEKKLKAETSRQGDAERARRAVQEVLARPRRPSVVCRHTPAVRFRPGEPLAVELSLDKADSRSVRLHFRRVNQAEGWRAEDMQWRDSRYRAVIPGDYTQSPYPLQYYFELREASEAWIYPGFDANLANLPYFVVRQV